MKPEKPKNRRNFLKKQSNSDLKWFLEKVFVPILLVTIPLTPSTIALLRSEQPPTPAQKVPAIDRTTPPSIDFRFEILDFRLTCAR
ncbi:hypothetical protein QUB56_00945 [Microcoleus sp. AR_TQ3_B6]|uniref:hypothetical protein n=1 Tax=Microcoleus sp. AR_TQ3_B6 TaxID=3055284 RepID=UPI002FD65284